MQKKKLLLGGVIVLIIIILAVFFLFQKPQPEFKRSTTSDYISPPVGEITKNWITVSESERYFTFEDGNSFFPIGTALNGAYITYDATEQQFVNYLEGMKASGENFLRIDTEGFSWNDDYASVKKKIGNGTITFLEKPAGIFNENYAKKLDRFFKLAEENGVYVELLIFSHSCTLSDKFDLYPYYTSNGGPITNLAELRSNSEAKELFKQRLRYISDRWGNSPNLFMYELYNEIEWPACGAGDANDSKNWVEEMGNYLRDYEKARYKKSHLIGASAGLFELKPEYKFFLSSTGTDVLQTHYYHSFEKFSNPVTGALQVKTTVTDLLKESNYQKPYLENERNPVNLYTTNENITYQNQQYFIWAYLASGAAGGGALWTGVDTPTRVAKTAKIINPFLGEIDFSNFNSKPFTVSSSNSQIVPFVVGDENTVVGWLMHNNPTDYYIESITWWKQHEKDLIKKPLAQLRYLNLWRELMISNNAPVDDNMLTNEVSKIIQSIGINSKTADEISLKIVLNPSGNLAGFRNQEDQNLDIAEVQDAFFEILNTMTAYYESLENQYHPLKDLYTGHPEVLTTISLDLEAGEYSLQWYDSNNGGWLESSEISGGHVILNSPIFSRHVAFLIKKI